MSTAPVSTPRALPICRFGPTCKYLAFGTCVFTHQQAPVQAPVQAQQQVAPPVAPKPKPAQRAPQAPVQAPQSAPQAPATPQAPKAPLQAPPQAPARQQARQQSLQQALLQVPPAAPALNPNAAAAMQAVPVGERQLCRFGHGCTKDGCLGIHRRTTQQVSKTGEVYEVIEDRYIFIK